MTSRPGRAKFAHGVGQSADSEGAAVTPELETPMRFLVACTDCKRQYDASGLDPGRQFRCLCGRAVTVPEGRAHDAAVVRCSACGGSRSGEALTCQYCGADFTLHERDLRTICPCCLARVSDRARYCHYCATPILPEGRAGSRTEHSCPACEGQHRLHSRSLGQPPVSVLECSRCAGLWLSQEAFQVVADRAREAAVALADPPAGRQASGASRPSSEGRTLYRRCPVCGERMHRRNHGGKDGAIIDRCKDHGFWFDAEELERILRWVRGGGESRVEERRQAEARHAARQVRLTMPDRSAWQQPEPRTAQGSDWLGDVFRSLFEL